MGKKNIVPAFLPGAALILSEKRTAASFPNGYTRVYRNDIYFAMRNVYNIF